MEDDVEANKADPLFKLLLVPPPIGPDDPASPPDSILLDPFGFISHRENTTTAQGTTRANYTIKVTFWPAQPPRVSVFTVYCPGLSDFVFGNFPQILAAEADLILLRITICRLGEHWHHASNNYFIYKVGKKGPALDLIPSDPDDPRIPSGETALLHCRSRNMYFIATLRRQAPRSEQYHMHIYNSKTKTWTTKLMRASKEFSRFYPSKVITIGGPLGSLGWVDLWRGILICDLLQEGCHLRYIPLPSPSVPSRVLDNGPPTYVRDIMVVQGKIKYFDMTNYLGLDPEIGYHPNGWEAEICELDPSNNHQKWKESCRIKLSEITVSDPTHLRMLPNLKEGEEDAEPILKRLYASCPSMSLHHDGVVYITNKIGPHDAKTWVTAVDMRHKALHNVAYYDPSGRKLSYGSAFVESEISKHLAFWSVSCRNREKAAETRKPMQHSGKQKIEGATYRKIKIRGVQDLSI